MANPGSKTNAAEKEQDSSAECSPQFIQRVGDSGDSFQLCQDTRSSAGVRSENFAELT